VLDEELGSLNLPLTNEPLDKDLVLSAVITSCSLFFTFCRYESNPFLLWEKLSQRKLCFGGS
jgi:hypothetical protein